MGRTRPAGQNQRAALVRTPGLRLGMQSDAPAGAMVAGEFGASTRLTRQTDDFSARCSVFNQSFYFKSCSAQSRAELALVLFVQLHVRVPAIPLDGQPVLLA